MKAAGIGLALLSLLLAWTLLYLGSARTRAALDTPAPSARVCRSAALVLMLVALRCCIAAQGLSMGSLLWTALLCATPHAVVAIATWAPHWLPGLLRRAYPSGRGQRR